MESHKEGGGRNKRKGFGLSPVKLGIVLIILFCLLLDKEGDLITGDVYASELTEAVLTQEEVRSTEIEIYYSVSQYYQRPDYGGTTKECNAHWSIWGITFIALGIVYILEEQYKKELLKIKEGLK